MDTNNVAAQAGDEPMREAFEEWMTEKWFRDFRRNTDGDYIDERIMWAWEGFSVSPRATPAVTDALQVCVKALEFRKERSANDEFALNLARIALAGSPRATADVGRDAARYRWLRERPYSDWKRIAFNTMDDHPFAIRCRDEEIDAAISTTKPGA